MVGFGEGAMVPQQVEPSHAVRASHEINWVAAFLMTTVLIAAVAGVVLALSSGMPTVAILIALVTGAVFAGQAC
ncbi:hypothetical protein [Mycolicibacterium psychrotolerans]|uniref:Uncharacterized protein n=1 Tax=Mycolicibacterium psychrotolerans TaxID=216929 RepID=A0A7I7MIK2_9MYCO|nr:hypothetical protein [Mycolicibacterium psychrotolerans]BBX72008.1 hypothetical protein MPSYJ_54690 [Mycolicibacterium psychrotolerans]